MTKIAINGFGRIGRAAFKIAVDNPEVEVVAINDLADIKVLANLLKYDSVYGVYNKDIKAEKDSIKINDKEYKVISEPEPKKLPWKKLGVDVVLECTGVFTKKETANGHISAGAKRVIISAPTKDNTQTMVLGTQNTDFYLKKGKSDTIVSMASCTTNCISPVMQILDSKFGVEKSLMTTIHSYTASQNLVDTPHKDPRRGRAGAVNIVPTTTGAANATTKTIRGLKNKFDGMAIRVPTICGSLSDITVILKRKKVTVKQINETFTKMTNNYLYKNILTVSKEPLVSTDIIRNPYSAIVDLPFTKVVGGNMVKILAWYDNEWGYSSRLVDLAKRISLSQ